MNLLAKNIFPATILLLQGCYAAADQVPYTPEQCARFALFDFRFQDFDKYDNYFDASSTLTLPQAGVHTGPDAIEEYVRFLFGSSPFNDEVTNYFGFAEPFPIGFDPLTGICKFTRYHVSGFQLNSSLTTGNLVTTGWFASLFYSIPTKKISKIDVFMTPNSLRDYFSQLDTGNALEFICDTLTGPSCSSALGKATEQGLSRNECIQDLSELPLAEGESFYVDSNTKGCRALHAVFAAKNDLHCAHVSLTPFADHNGIIKCQESRNLLSAPTDDEMSTLLDMCANSPYVDDNCSRITHIAEDPITKSKSTKKGKKGNKSTKKPKKEKKDKRQKENKRT